MLEREPLVVGFRVALVGLPESRKLDEVALSLFVPEANGIL